ncbi:MAG: hypothetical protein MK233_01680 [Candidatus Poseidoniales archaeon]|nr:hypothetical protein [Candidatus Poseidoniales archaeon]
MPEGRGEDVLGWTMLFALIGGALLWYSKHQPFPEISGLHGRGWLLIAGLLLIGEQAPTQTADLSEVSALVACGLGGVGVLAGVRHMSVTRRDVVVAPLSGLLLCFGAIAILASGWQQFTGVEQIGAFLLAALLILGEIYLFFRGMIVGTTGRMWSAAGMRQLERGLLHGPPGAIACFERSWDAENEYIDAMSHAALVRIHAHLKNSELERTHRERLARLGGEEAVDGRWLKEVEKRLRRLTPPSDESE